MTEPASAVFLSYASQDVDAARRIGEALRAAGIEVWFDQSALRGGDAWDQLIRGQIRDCALFMPLISATTSARHEGYFRLEWSLADQRSQMIARNRAFIVPVCLDDTSETAADVPESFQRVQWTRLRSGDTPAEFVTRVAALVGAATRSAARPPIAPSPLRPSAESAPAPSAPRPQTRSRRTVWLTATIALVVAVAALGVWQYVHRAPTVRPMAGVVAEADKSIAVMPFQDMSEAHDQAYFADGLAEEVLDLLAQVPGLRVPARSSSFYFKGRNEKLAVIAKELGVAHVLEGTVRRSGSTIRVSVQLVRADTGYHLWSSIYDRDVKDVFKVQDEISAAVVTALKAKLADSGNPTAYRTSVPEAYDRYLVARYLYQQHAGGDWPAINAGLHRAIELDPNFAQAYALLAVTAYVATDGQETRDPAAVREAFEAANRAVALAPDRGEGYSARAFLRLQTFDVAGADADLKRALELDPNDPKVYRRLGFLHNARGEPEVAVASFRRAVELDPLDLNSLQALANALAMAGHDDEARAELQRAQRNFPNSGAGIDALLGTLLAKDGHLPEARTECSRAKDVDSRVCLALLDWAEGRQERARDALEAIGQEHIGSAKGLVASAYASIGDGDRAFYWLNRAADARDRGLANLPSEADWAHWRSDPRYLAVLRKLKLLP